MYTGFGFYYMYSHVISVVLYLRLINNIIGVHYILGIASII